MKSLLLALTATLAPRIHAHYYFPRLIVNNTVSTDFQYVRDISSASGSFASSWLKSYPLFGPENTNITCGRLSFPVRNTAIQTATVLAGDDVGFHVSGPYEDGDPQPVIYHQGPGQMFLSRLPEDVEDLIAYDGSGEWFKIGYQGPKTATMWALQGELAMNATVPRTTPPGKYLLRIEQFFASPTLGQSQWFVNCAHIEVVGPGGGAPGPYVRFPNAYAAEDPSVWFHVYDEQRMYDRFPDDIRVYVELKPEVWKG